MRTSPLFRLHSVLFVLFSGLLISGCSQKMSDVNTSIEELYSASQDVALTAQAIQDLPYPSTYVRLNDEQQIFMVLAFADKNPVTGNMQLKWISSDSALIITENGRIIKTVGLENDNLVGITSEHLASPVSDTATWQASYDWMPDYRYHFTASVTPQSLGEQVIESSQWKLHTQRYQESVRFDALDAEFANQYWVASDGQVMKSIQYIGPSMTKVEMTILKPFALADSQ